MDGLADPMYIQVAWVQLTAALSNMFGNSQPTVYISSKQSRMVLSMKSLQLQHQRHEAAAAAAVGCCNADTCAIFCSITASFSAASAACPCTS